MLNWQVCTTGFYGEKCSSICGYCLNNSVCDHVTGVCEQGCEPGYQGENCTEGMWHQGRDSVDETLGIKKDIGDFIKCPL